MLSSDLSADLTKKLASYIDDSNVIDAFHLQYEVSQAHVTLFPTFYF